jgi:hypothetical protein
MRRLSCLMLMAAALTIPAARADILFTGSQAGLCCFDVLLHQVNSTDVQVTATLTDGAIWFADTGNPNGNHPGFAFNIAGDPAISISNISGQWTSSNVKTGSVTSDGPNLGIFDYWFTNPGGGTSAHNAGPLIFDVNVAAGVSVNSFVANLAGFYFAADIARSAANTGESGINLAPTSVPEPSAVILLGVFFLFGTAAFGVITSLRRYLGGCG